MVNIVRIGSLNEKGPDLVTACWLLDVGRWTLNRDNKNFVRTD